MRITGPALRGRGTTLPSRSACPSLRPSTKHQRCTRQAKKQQGAGGFGDDLHEECYLPAASGSKPDDLARTRCTRSLANLQKGTLDDLVRQVHARRTELFQDLPGTANRAIALSPENNSQCASEWDTVRLGTATGGQVINDCNCARIRKSER